MRRSYILKNQSKEQIPLLKTQNLPQLAGRRLSRTMNKTMSYCQAGKSRCFPISEDLCATEGVSQGKQSQQLSIALSYGIAE